MQKCLFFLFSLLFLALFSTANVYAATPKKWTFLIYINGKNNLDSFGTANIKSMEKIGSDDQVNVVVEWGSYETTKTLRLLVQKSTDPNSVTSPILEDLGSVDMGDYKTLEDFIQWGVKNFPAEHYFVDVWNHGGGWHLGQQVSRCTSSHLKSHFSDISWDELTGHAITTEQLGDVMQHASQMMGHKVDIYGSDACLMGMAEVADQMHDAVNYFVGSEEVIPGQGWPYTKLLSRWEAVPNASPETVSKILVEEYVKFYQGGEGGYHQVTFSAYDMSQLTALNQAIARLALDIRSLTKEDKEKVIKAIKQAQSFVDRDYRDLIDLIKQFSMAEIAGIHSKNLEDIQFTANQFIIANAVTPRYEKATGLSLWAPSYREDFSEYAKRYQGLQFNLDTSWGKALESLYTA